MVSHACRRIPDPWASVLRGKIKAKKLPYDGKVERAPVAQPASKVPLPLHKVGTVPYSSNYNPLVVVLLSCKTRRAAAQAPPWFGVVHVRRPQVGRYRHRLHNSDISNRFPEECAGLGACGKVHLQGPF